MRSLIVRPIALLFAAASSLALFACAPHDSSVGGSQSNLNGQDGGPCEAGQTKQADDGCNGCVCSSDGQWACTVMACGAAGASSTGGTSGAGSSAGTGGSTGTAGTASGKAGAGSGTAGAGGTTQACTPGHSMPSPDGCNTCACTPDGQWACTAKACVACIPGETKPAEDGCNTCSCASDGQGWSCTKIGCGTGGSSSGGAGGAGGGSQGCSQGEPCSPGSGCGTASGGNSGGDGCTTSCMCDASGHLQCETSCSGSGGSSGSSCSQGEACTPGTGCGSGSAGSSGGDGCSTSCTCDATGHLQCTTSCSAQQCAPQDAAGIGTCEKYLGVRWTGTTCEPLGGCSCGGNDCGTLYPSLEACQLDNKGCPSL